MRAAMALLLLLVSCGPAGPELDVSVRWPAGLAVHHLTVIATLRATDGITREETRPVAERPDRFRLRLHGGFRGTASLRVSAFDERPCQLAAGAAELELLADRREAVTLDLQEERGCRVEVSVQGDGEVRGAGAPCGAELLCHYDLPLGTQLSLEALPATTRSYFLGWEGDCAGPTCRAVIGSGVLRVRALFGQTRVCSRDCFCWENPAPQGNVLVGLWASSPRDVWAVGDRGTVLRYNGLVWNRVETPARWGLKAIWGSGPKDVWLVGSGGLVLHYDGQRFETVPTGSQATLLGAFGHRSPGGETELWVSSSDGRVLHLQKGRFTAEDVGSADFLRAIAGTGPRDLWLAGADTASASGVVLHYDGERWREVLRTPEVLLGLTLQDGQPWAVGAPGVVLRKDAGDEWHREALPLGPIDLTSITADATGPWVSGAGGRVLQYRKISEPGAGPRYVPFEVQSGTAVDLHAVLRTGQPDVWAVGAGGALLLFNGAAFAPRSAGFAETINAIDGDRGTPDGLRVAAGDAGTFFFSQATTWGPRLSKKSPGTLLDIAFAGADLSWMVGTGGTVLAIASGDLYRVPTGTQDLLSGVWARGDEAFAVGGMPERRINGAAVPAHGLILRVTIDRVKSTVVLSQVAQPRLLLDISGTSAADLWAVGGNGDSAAGVIRGVILHYDGAAWTTVREGEGDLFHRVWAAGPRNVWVAGGRSPVNDLDVGAGFLLHYDGAGWSRDRTLDFFPLSLDGSGPEDLWVGGPGGRLLRRSRGAWQELDAGFGGAVQGIFAPDAERTWIVGDNGAILSRVPGPHCAPP